MSSRSPLDIQRVAPDLSLGSDGIWYAAAPEALSYPDHGNQSCFQVEDTSFWFRHRNACITALVGCFPPTNGDAIFDIGGGNGIVSMALSQSGFETVLVEPGRTGAENARNRGLDHVVCATAMSAKFRDASIGAVGLFDVVEHIQDDMAFISSIRRMLRRNGRLYATVPAYQALWSGEDISAGHFRRHTQRSIRGLLERSGLRVDFITYIFRPLPPPIYLLRTLPHRLGLVDHTLEGSSFASDHSPLSSPWSRILDAVLRSEVRRIKALRPMSFGSTCLVAATAI